MELSGPVQAALASAVAGGGISWLVTRLTKRYDSGSAASAAEVTVRAQLVQDMQRELGSLRTSLTEAWTRNNEAAEKYRSDMAEADRLQREAFQKYQHDMEALDRRWRHLARELLTRDAALRRLLRRSGVPDSSIPEFKGLEQFAEEGGAVPDDWIRAFYGDPSEDVHNFDILIIDDNRSLIAAWSRSLEHEGYLCACVYSGAEALRIAHQHWPKLMIIDLILGDTDGLKLIDEMRTSGYRGKALAVTGGSVEFSNAALASDKFDAVLQKPLTLNELCSSVKRLMTGG